MPLTPYTTNIPLAVQPINQTQQAINDNFTCLVNNAAPANGLITVNHIGTSDPINYGKHFFIEVPVVVPASVTTAAEVAMYSKNGTVSTQPELFFQRQSLGIDAGTPMTEYKVNNPAGPVRTNGYTWLPSGFKIIWGTSATTGGVGNKTIVYATEVPSFPGFTAYFTIPQVTASSVGSTLYISSASQTQFVVTNNTGTASIAFSWMAIGL